MSNSTSNDTASYSFCLQKQKFCDPSEVSTATLANIGLFLMFLVFVAAFIFYLVIFIRQLRQKSFLSTILFYLCLILFCLGRTVYFLLRIIFRFGYGVDTSNLELESNLSVFRHIAYIFYYFASTFLYSAFIILSLNWGEFMLQSITKLTFRTLLGGKVFFIVINLLLHGAQIVLLVAMLVSVIVKATDASLQSVYTAQLSYHAVLSFAIVVLYFVWMNYIWLRLRGKRSLIDKKDQMFLLMIMISLVLLLRCGYNIGMAVYNTFCPGMCDNVQPIIFAAAITLFDGIPLLWVAVVMKDSHRLTSDSEVIKLGKGDKQELHDDDHQNEDESTDARPL